MGILKNAREKSKKNLAEARAKTAQKLYFVCPTCGGTMKPILVGVLEAAKEPKVKCEDCGLKMFQMEAERTLERPTA